MILRKNLVRTLHNHNTNLTSLAFSLEQIIYYVRVPTLNLALKEQSLEHYHILLDREYFGCLGPQAWEIYTQLGDEELLLAELPFRLFEIPTLNTLCSHGKITEGERRALYIEKFLHFSTAEHVIREVYTRVKGLR